jgi:hypothetical protein
VRSYFGTPLFAFDGSEIKDIKVVPFAQVSYETYDGDGRMNGAHSGNFDGEITRNKRLSGTYDVKADCTGTLRYKDGRRYALFLHPDGSRFTFVQSNPELVGGPEREPRPLWGACGPSAGSLDDRLHLVVIEGAQRGRPDVALRR